MTTPDTPEMKATEARLPLSLGLAMLPILALFAAIGISMATVGTGGGALLLSIMFAAATAGLVAKHAGAGWDAIQQETGRQIADALPAILILLTIGALIGSWMFSGTIPLMVVLGIDLINPDFMVLTAFVATALMSLISGTSWGSAGTIGVALMGAAEALGLPLAPVAGAVVSGAYFGDKLSPLSDMTNIAAIGAGADLYRHIRCMLWTSLPAAAVALLAFAALGFAGDAGAALDSSDAALIRSELSGAFDLGFLPALPLLVALAGIVMRKPPALVILLSSLLALFIGIVGQGFSFANAVASFVDGFAAETNLPDTSLSPSVENLLNRGGLMSMAGTLLFIVAAFLLAAGMKVSGAIDRLLAALLGIVRSVVSLVGATIVAGMMMVAMTSHGGVSALILGGLFRKPFAERDLAPEHLSRTIEDSVTVTEPLMPWTVSGVFMASTLGVPTLALAPWAIFCWLGPVTSLLAAVVIARDRRPA
ncbi:Na+/H+ antiporter NhaC family protein [Aurantiacibacter sp. D1-12]|uniref:Na+/H+ antiporter NhaC family protein n=1 Tax=Aurantiacibacter sp. D1-12 TaxID=2993658 RepID=UPI00237C6419|nr:Na+/H+ antiporter NhaC family protein [Aurantiacibacter sp. D1-12]MDE1467742.1 hypothetical protein [Aurantiacibacter sp. D1-12]